MYLREQSGIHDTVKRFGWSDWEISFSRGQKSQSGTVNYGIRSDFQMRLELPRIIDGGDKLHGNCNYVATCFVLLWSPFLH